MLNQVSCDSTLIFLLLIIKYFNQSWMNLLRLPHLLLHLTLYHYHFILLFDFHFLIHLSQNHLLYRLHWYSSSSVPRRGYYDFLSSLKRSKPNQFIILLLLIILSRHNPDSIGLLNRAIYLI